MRRVTGLALAIVLASLLAWGLVNSDDDPQPAGSVDRPSEEPASAPPRLEGDATEATDRPDRVDRRDPKSPRADVERSPNTVTVLVVRAGVYAPIEGATVCTAEGETATTDAEGRGTVTVMHGTTCVVRKLGFATRWVDVGTAEDTVRIELTAAPVLSGRVIDAASGEPLPDTWIRVVIEDMPWQYVDVPEPTDETGTFHVAGVPPGSMFEIRVLQPGYATAVVHAGSPAEGDEPLEVRLGSGAVLSGMVRNADGPVGDVNVFVVPRGVDLPLRPDPGTREALGYVTTDAAGHYRIRGLKTPAEVVVLARHRLGAWGRSEVISLPHEGIEEIVDITLSTTGSIVLHLEDARTGTKVDPRLVRCSLDQDWTEASDHQKAHERTTAGDVYFREVRAGRHQVFVDPVAHLVPAPREVEVAPGSLHVLTFELDPGLEVTGRVVDPRGRPLEVYVSFYAEYGGVMQYPNTRTDEKTGRFTLEAVPPVAGELSVFDNQIGTRTWSDRKIAGDLGDLVLASGPYVVGRLPEALRGQALDCGINGQRSGGMLDVAEDGSFRIGVVPANEKVSIYLRPDRGAAWVLRDAVLEPGEVRDLGEIAFPVPLALEGTLLDASGEPVRGALVRPADWWCVSRTRTDADGHFRLADLPPGRTTLWIEAGSLAVTFHDVEMREGMAPIEVRLPQPGTLKIRLVKEGGETLPNVPMNVVRLLNTGEPDWDRRKILRTDSRGLLDEKLPPGPYGVIPHDNANLEVLGETMKVLIVSNRTTEVDILVK